MISMQTKSNFYPDQWPIAWMARAERQHTRNATLALSPLGIHQREFRLLAFLSAHAGLTINELVELAVLERPTVSKMLVRFESQGWVSRRPCIEDRRCFTLHLTSKGQDLFNKAAPIIETLFRQYQSNMSKEEQMTLISSTRKFFERVRDAKINQA